MEKERFMMSAMRYDSFGTFLSTKRTERNISLREMARRIGISAPFLSDVERNKAAPLTIDRLYQVSEILSLSLEEQYEMYDIIAWQKHTIAPDLPEYIMDNRHIVLAIRVSREVNAEEADWIRCIEILKSIQI